MASLMIRTLPSCARRLYRQRPLSGKVPAALLPRDPPVRAQLWFTDYLEMRKAVGIGGSSWNSKPGEECRFARRAAAVLKFAAALPRARHPAIRCRSASGVEGEAMPDEKAPAQAPESQKQGGDALEEQLAA